MIQSLDDLLILIILIISGILFLGVAWPYILAPLVVVYFLFLYFLPKLLFVGFIVLLLSRIFDNEITMYIGYSLMVTMMLIDLEYTRKHKCSECEHRYYGEVYEFVSSGFHKQREDRCRIRGKLKIYGYCFNYKTKKKAWP